MASCAPPVTREISSPPQREPATLSSLSRETFVSFSTSRGYLAATRRLPLAPGLSSQEALDFEFEETRQFERKQLKADPRLRPEGLAVSYDHLRQCASCAQRREVRRLQHGAPANLSGEWQLLVDDYAVHAWRNAVRFVARPRTQRVVLSPPSASHTRFGCPCSVLRVRKSFRMYHAAGTTAGNASRYKEWPREYAVSSSPDGLDWWGPPTPLSVDGFSSSASLTGSFTAGAAGGGGRRRRGFAAGYEGANSRVCLAHSADGKRWRTVSTDVAPRVREARREARPAHLTTAYRKRMAELSGGLTLRKKHVLRACDDDIRRCVASGASSRASRVRHEANGSAGAATSGRISRCLLAAHANRTLSGRCAAAARLDARGEMARVDCVDGSHSALGRAGDCTIQPLYLSGGGGQIVWFRRDYGTAGGWREIRGVQVHALEPPLDAHADGGARVHSYYLDRLGKLERFRRQIYSLSFTRHSSALWLGLMTVIEWAKDGSERRDDGGPRFSRDTTAVYLVTSRDGVHVDDEWVYARQPLLRKGTAQREWNSGFQLAASEIVTADGGASSRVYFEARRERHEDRFSRAGVIGVAAWPRLQLVGLRAADAAAPAVVATKRFVLHADRAQLYVSVDTTATPCGNGSLLVEMVGAAARPLASAARHAALRIAATHSVSLAVLWRVRDGAPTQYLPIERGAALRLRFSLFGTARIYGFRLVGR
ncbi:hypothetical protein AB1Y20_014856 [Prymnesium parvum]|uniref:F5/8 type C domain-containing protein n=1 Tax=Prymnesium parvum TaxID=97485 RepID=A0AB34JVF0_PRYPA